MTEESLALDLKQCEMSAPQPKPLPPPAPRKTPGSLIDFDSVSERQGDRFIADQRYLGECMRKKGYVDAS
jgi:hypothetical protein